MKETMVQFSGPKTDRTGGHGMPRASRYRFDILRGEDIPGVNPVCDRFHAYWWAIKPPMGLPRRQDIKMAELRRHSAHAVILDIEGGHCFEQTFTLRVRLIGTAVAEHYGEITGRDVADMDNQGSARRIYYACGLAIEAREPLMSITHAFSPDAPYKDVFAIFLPLGNEKGEVSKILIAAAVRYFTG